jgi:hypothetical protein
MATDPNEEYPFEQFPHGEIHLGTPRRKFLTGLLREMRAYKEKGDVHRSKKLSDLGNWSDEELYSVIPMIAPDSKWEVNENNLCGINGSKRRIILFSTQSPAFLVYNLFDGSNALDEIADTLSRQMDWPTEKSFAYSRGVFLSLVTIGLCQPKW